MLTEEFMAKVNAGSEIPTSEWDALIPAMSIGRFLDLKDRWAKKRRDKKQTALIEMCFAPLDPDRDSMLQMVERNNLLLAAVLEKLP